MKTVTTRVIRQQMLVMAAAVYFFNAIFIVLLSGLAEYRQIFDGADMTAAFTLGLVFALSALYGTMHAHRRATLQLLTFAYMLPLTGTCMITMAALYMTQRHMSESYGIWVLMSLTAVLLAMSFGIWWKATEQNVKAVVA